MAGSLPPPESIGDRIRLWMQQDGAAPSDVSRETSDPVEEEAEASAAEETEADEPADNAQLEGDEVEEEEGGGLRTFADLAQRLELDEEALAKALHVTGRDGQEVSLHDVLTSYRTVGGDASAIERDRTRLADFERRAQAIDQEAEGLRRTAQALAAHMQRSEPDWEALRAKDPTGSQYLAARMDWDRRERQLEQAARQYEATMAARRLEFDEQDKATRRAEAMKLRGARAEWKDQAAFERDLGATEKYLLGLGYTADELRHVVSHRDWLVADKARRFEELQRKAPDVLKRVRGLPRTLAPGAGGAVDRGTVAARAKEGESLLSKLKASGKDEDGVALLRHRLQGNARRAAGRALASGRRS